MGNEDITQPIIIASAIFFLAPAALVSYLVIYNGRKKKHAEEKMQMEHDFNSELVKTQHEIREQTMQTIGADLHDNIGQLLSLTSFTLKSIAHNEPEVMLKKVHDAIDLTARSIQEMRLLGKLLQGEQLVGLGLHEAIKQEVHWLQKTGVYEVNYTCKGLDNTPGNPEKDLILFRILQEIINNTIKHAQATCINVDLNYDDKLKLTIADNGVGFMMNELSAQQMGMGLQNIQKRASMIGGETTISSLPGNGTTIHVFIPYP
jgi:two-component system NarL family sensor kinase